MPTHAEPVTACHPPAVGGYAAVDGRHAGLHRAGYLLSRHVGATDCTGIELRRVTVATDHSPRKPDAWALSWCGRSREEQVEEAAVWGSSGIRAKNYAKPRRPEFPVAARAGWRARSGTNPSR